MLVRIALVLVGFPLLAHGAEGLYHAYKSRTRAQVTCEQFHRQRPRSGWLGLTGCEVDYVRAGYRETRGRVTELFFPVRPAGSSPAVPSALVLSTRDPRLLAIIDRELAGPAQKDQEAFLVMMLQVVTAMRTSREIEGVTRSPIEMLWTRRTFGAIKAPLADTFTVLDLHARPRFLFPAVETAVGALALVLAALFARPRRTGAARLDTPPATAAPVGAAAPAASAPRQDEARFRRLMLVNLPPRSLPVALEKAPPLGQQAQVQDALARVLPGIHFNQNGVGQFNRPDHVIRLDLGTTPEVWTATLDVTGDGAATAVKRLVTQTGWQVYAPRQGRFLTAGDFNS